MTGASIVGLRLDRDSTFNTKSGEIAPTMGLVKRADFDAMRRRLKAQTDFAEDMLFCVDGSDYVSKHNF